jgi:hypothetical protein
LVSGSERSGERARASVTVRPHFRGESRGFAYAPLPGAEKNAPATRQGKRQSPFGAPPPARGIPEAVDERKPGAATGTRFAGDSTIGAIAFLIVALALVAVVPLVLNYLGLENATQWLFTVARWPLLLLAIAVALAVIYRYGPSRSEPKWRWITWGSAFAAVAWIVLSLLFSWYAANFASYNRTYGSLGAVIAFMTWMWLSATVVLVGAAIDVETGRQAVPDTGNKLPNRGTMGQGARAHAVNAERLEL